MNHTKEEILAAAEESAGGLQNEDSPLARHYERAEHIAGFEAGYAFAMGPPHVPVAYATGSQLTEIDSLLKHPRISAAVKTKVLTDKPRLTTEGAAVVIEQLKALIDLAAFADQIRFVPDNEQPLVAGHSGDYVEVPLRQDGQYDA